MKNLKAATAMFGFLFLSMATTLFAQTKADIFDPAKEITWLGIDFSQAKFIGGAYQFKDAGEITNAEFRDKYSPGWNQLFVDEPKKFDVAEAVHRTEVKYATNVADKANSMIKTYEFFSNNPDDYKKLDQEKIKAVVKNYDFKDNKGIGMLMIVDGMSKSKEEMGVWVTFVNMQNKTVLLTEYETGKAKGFGFRNYWAGAFDKILNSVKSDFKDWNK